MDIKRLVYVNRAQMNSLLVEGLHNRKTEIIMDTQGIEALLVKLELTTPPPPLLGSKLSEEEFDLLVDSVPSLSNSACETLLLKVAPSDYIEHKVG